MDTMGQCAYKRVCCKKLKKAHKNRVFLCLQRCNEGLKCSRHILVCTY